MRLNESTCQWGSNRSGYRGRNHRLLSGALGLCLVGVKRGPTVRSDTYCCVNVGSATAGLPSQRRQTGLAAADVVVAWQSGRSSPSQEQAWHMAKDRSHCKRIGTGSRED